MNDDNASGDMSSDSSGQGGEQPTNFTDSNQQPLTGEEPSPTGEPKPRKLRKMLWIILVVVGLLIIAGGAFMTYRFITRDEQATTLKIGILAAFTGGSSTHGHGIAKGVELAQKELGSTNVEIVQEDSQCDPKVGQEAMQRLIDQDVDVVIGDGCSSVSVAVLPLANNTETPMVSPGASSPALSIPNDYFFRVIPSDVYQGSFMAQTIYDAGHRRVAVFYTNEPYGSGMNSEFRERFESLGGQVVATATSEPDVIELNDMVAELKAANPDALFVAPNSILTGASVIQTASELGMNVPKYGADIFYDTTVIENAPEGSKDLTISTFNTGTPAFKLALAENSPVQEQLFAAAGAYDAFDTIQRAYQMGARTGREFKDTFPQIEFPGVSALIRFNGDGELPGVDYIYSLLKVEGDGFTEI
jgi:branched-chain amino acid transport system substrate-binding protein